MSDSTRPPAAVPFDEAEIDGSVGERFRRVAAAMPAQPAIQTAEQVLSYGALDQLSDSVAGHVAAHAASSEGRIGLLFSPEDAHLLVAVLGVLKAGHSFVGLSPDFPTERNRAVWADADGLAILTSRRHAAQAGTIADERQPVLVIEALLAETRAAPVLAITGRQMAALYYTSGSTGRPKGVVRQQRELLARARLAATDGFDGPGDRAVLSYFVGYSASASRIFNALLNGATTLPINSAGMTAGDWIRLLQREAITSFEPPIALMRQILADATEPLDLPQLRLVGLGGDVLLRQDMEALRACFPKQVVVMHRLSSSECGLVARSLLTHDTPIVTDKVPIGWPLAQTEVLLWDDDQRPVAEGEAGEIVVRSALLTPGYWRNPELNRKMFLPDPEGGERRLFRSGDLGRRLPDGSLMHLGRKDQMLKVRGHRVEPQEVEAALRKLEGVGQAAVVAHERVAGEKELVAWLVPAAGAELTPARLRGELAATLPSHMLPARFAVLDELPVNANGKLDRMALATRPLPPLETGEQYVAPRDDLERQMVAIWQAVLKLPQVGVQDNFFDLGGNSLAAMALMTRLARATGRGLPLTALFAAPTIAQLAEAWRHAGQRQRQASTLVPLQPVGAGLPLFLVPELETSALNLMRLIRFMGTGHPIFGLHPRGFDDGLTPRGTLAEAAADYVRAIQAVRPAGPYLLAGICHGGLVAFEMAQQLLAQGQKVRLLALIDVPGVARHNQDARQQAVSWYRNTRRQWAFWKKYTRGWRGRAETAPDDEATSALNATRRLRYVQRVAHLRYRARPYAGEVRLLQSAEFHARGVQADWAALTPAGLQVEVAAGLTHKQLLSERAHQREMALWLTRCLDSLEPAQR
jgi:amino acid adenylation domain-containing protein